MPAFDLELGRDGGLTHVIDKGLGPRGWEDVLETSGDYIDIVKLGWGTAYVTPNLERKLEVLAGKRVVLGGTFFEVVYVRGKLDEYKTWLSGARDRPRRDLRRHGRHPARAEARADRRLRPRLHRPLRGRLEGLRGRVRARTSGCSGSRRSSPPAPGRSITESREGGTAGIFRPSGEMRTGLVDEIAHEIDFHDLIWEAPTQGEPGLVHQALRPERQPREHPARRGHPARDAPPRAARRHAEGGAARWRAGPRFLSSTTSR